MFYNISKLLFKKCKKVNEGEYLIQLKSEYKQYNPIEFDGLYNYVLIIRFYNGFGEIFKYTNKQDVITFYYPINDFWNELTREFCEEETRNQYVNINEFLYLKQEVDDLKILIIDIISIINNRKN